MIRATCLFLAASFIAILGLAACSDIPLSPGPSPAFARTALLLTAPPADLTQR